MESLVAIYNPNSSPVVIGTFLFTSGVPVIIYRNTEMFGDENNAAALIAHINGVPEDVAGDNPLLLLASSFDGSTLSPDEAVNTINTLSNEYKQAVARGSYSMAYWWNRVSCDDMLDGMQKQLNGFDWTNPDVHIDRVTVMEKALMTVTCLNAGFLADELDAINVVQPDGDFEFLSATRLGQFKALFTSALETE